MGSIPAKERENIKSIIEAGLKDRTAISADMFDSVQKLVFKEMFYNTFQRFVNSPKYAQMHKDIRNAYNKVGEKCLPHVVKSMDWFQLKGRLIVLCSTLTSHV